MRLHPSNAQNGNRSISRPRNRFGRIFVIVLLGCSVIVYDVPEASEARSAVAGESERRTTRPAMPNRGKILFLQCRSCHSLENGGEHLVGPNLSGLFGSAAGAKDGFVYSSAVVSSDLIWTDETLDLFLAKPTEFLPGTKMAFAGVTSADDRRDLIEYLRINAR